MNKSHLSGPQFPHLQTPQAKAQHDFLSPLQAGGSSIPAQRCNLKIVLLISCKHFKLWSAFMRIWRFYIKILIPGFSWEISRSGHSGLAFPTGGRNWKEETVPRTGNELPTPLLSWSALAAL